MASTLKRISSSKSYLSRDTQPISSWLTCRGCDIIHLCSRSATGVLQTDGNDSPYSPKFLAVFFFILLPVPAPVIGSRNTLKPFNVASFYSCRHDMSLHVVTLLHSMCGWRYCSVMLAQQPHRQGQAVQAATDIQLSEFVDMSAHQRRSPL